MYNPYSLLNKTILVTGASSGIGRATAVECSKLGASVIISGRNEDRLQETYSMLDLTMGQKHIMISADLSSEKGVKDLVENLPEVDGVSSNAGINNGHIPVKFIKQEELLDVVNANVFSHIHLAKLLFKKKKLKKGASYVFTASIGGVFSQANGQSVYGLSKGALNSFMKYCAIEFSGKKIRCNSVCPGMIVTHMTETLASVTDEDKEKDAEKYLLKRYGQPKEVALTTAFLLSDASSYITGTSIVIDGGYLANH